MKGGGLPPVVPVRVFPFPVLSSRAWTDTEVSEVSLSPGSEMKQALSHYPNTSIKTWGSEDSVVPFKGP